jgi:low temperature requirement protein LtrA
MISFGWVSGSGPVIIAARLVGMIANPMAEPITGTGRMPIITGLVIMVGGVIMPTSVIAMVAAVVGIRAMVSIISVVVGMAAMVAMPPAVVTMTTAIILAMMQAKQELHQDEATAGNK